MRRSVVRFPKPESSFYRSIKAANRVHAEGNLLPAYSVRKVQSTKLEECVCVTKYAMPVCHGRESECVLKAVSRAPSNSYIDSSC